MLKENLSHDSCIIHMDLSENYNTKYGEEIQAFHFGGTRVRISLHTVVVYMRNNDGSILSNCFCTLSSNLAYSRAAIWAHLKPIFEVIPDHNKHIYFLSDGPVTQYRNKTMFYMMGCHLKSFFNITSFS